tara:strand:- start:157 stop:381 length:225 start_codon:yes stop_codon:yes gene_type:complete
MAPLHRKEATIHLNSRAGTLLSREGIPLKAIRPRVASTPLDSMVLLQDNTVLLQANTVLPRLGSMAYPRLAAEL